ncbi:NADH-quinone oxidoreductase subunit G [Egibacter rhizosphaerae]|uniref:NADH-quinone oxidoreductase n=1 Tax=Egibacter rhizosphaerae TaxID=1670831 RepID=A0A411YGN3_9ACTN|nr:NADH-quinone oxidoreductase subunit G [Egibacter rhizosphaerae]
MSDETITLTIDGIETSVPKGTLVIRAAESLGITVPRFCDHPLLDPIGACRQCIVEIEGAAKPMTSCTTQATDGMVVKTHLTSNMARVAQEGQLEFLLINHPLDCPMCDKGGECPLQDQTLAHGPPDSRFIETKRRYEKPVPISPLIGLDRERCVLCARCTRFSQQISGDPFIELFERGALEQVAIYRDEPYHSYFSGNVVQICPVGALTASTYRFKSRPFDLRSADGICNQCSAGCNLRVDVRRGRLQRQLARDNMAVNESWNCDKGRFGFEFVDHERRVLEPQVRDEAEGLQPVSWRAATRTAARRLQAAVDAGGPESVGVLTGGRITDEDAYALGRFARDVIGTDHVDFRARPRTEDERPVLRAMSGSQPVTYEALENADVVILAGLNPKEEVPILFLRLRKAWRNRGQRIVSVGPSLDQLDDIAWRWIATQAGDEAAALRALAGDEQAPTPEGELAEVATAVREAQAGTEPGDGPRVVVLAGERLAQSPGALPAAAGLAVQLDASAPPFAWVGRRNNARGAVDAGLVPGLLPGGRTLDEPGPVADAWDRLPERSGLDARGILEAALSGELQALYLVGVDPARDFEDPELARRALDAVPTVIAQELVTNETTAYVDVLLPASAPQERTGSFTTWEGRRQPFPQAVSAQGVALEDWDILRHVARAMGRDLGWETATDIRKEAAPLMAPSTPLNARLSQVPVPRTAAPPRPEEGMLALHEVDWLLGHGDLLAGADELLATARPPAILVHPEDAERLGIGDGELVAVQGARGRIELSARVTEHVAVGSAVVPANSTDITPAEIGPEGVGPTVQVQLTPREAVAASDDSAGASA